MLVTAYTIAYLLLSILSLFIGFVALGTSIFVLSKWKEGVSTEEQYLLEKRVYLVITAIVLGVGMRVVMIPLWFLTLHSYIPSVPGAMCLAGIHQLRVPHSYIATGIKFFLPLFYLFWLAINHLDRQMEDQPILTFKLKCLVPMGVLMCVETFFDWIFLRAVEPRQVTCCTSLFDVPGENVPEIVSTNVWLWYILFMIITVALISINIFSGTGSRAVFGKIRGASGRNALAVFTSLLCMADLIVFTLALHTKISPLFLRAPFHHCVFCIYYNIWDGPLFNALVITGIWASLINSWMVPIAGKKSVPVEIVTANVRKLSLISSFLLLGGIAVILIHTAFVI